MKKTLQIDDRLLAEARKACGAATDTAAVRLGLEALVRKAAQERLAALLGTGVEIQEVPRRRFAPPRTRPLRGRGNGLG